MSRVCQCKSGYASAIDNKCRKCRSRREQQAFDDRRRAYDEGYQRGKAFPMLLDIACPYTLNHHKREGWIQGKNDAQREAS